MRPPTASRRPTATRRPVRVPRLSGGDLMQWQADVGPVPQHVGAVLLLAEGARPAADGIRALLAERLSAAPALGRRPVRAPFAGGWFWADDDRDVAAHVGCATVPSGGQRDVLDAAADVVRRPLPRDRSPWAATVLATPDGAAAAVVVVLHHVLTDGLAAFGVLDLLADPGPAADGPVRHPAEPVPSRAVLVRDAWARRLAAVRALPGLVAGLRRLQDARGELGSGHGAAPRTVLNRPTGPRRRLSFVAVPEDGVRAAAHALGASVNDVLLVAVCETLGTLAAAAGDRPDRLVVSVPVAVRRPDARSGVGNAVGVMPVVVPTHGLLAERVRRVAADRRRRLGADHGRSLPLVLLAFHVVHGLGLTRWFLDRQRLVNTFVTALPPLAGTVRLGGAVVDALVPLVMNQGNTTVALASVRYRGRLGVAVATDPDVGPDGERVAAGVRAALTALAPAGNGSRMGACPSRSTPTPTAGSWAGSPARSHHASPTSPASPPGTAPSTSAAGPAP